MNSSDIPAVIPVPVKGKRRIQGLRITAVPGFPLLAQVSGGIAALYGTYLSWGTSATLIAGGLAAVVLGMLKEGGKI